MRLTYTFSGENRAKTKKDLTKTFFVVNQHMFRVKSQHVYIKLSVQKNTNDKQTKNHPETVKTKTEEIKKRTSVANTKSKLILFKQDDKKRNPMGK